MYYRSSSLSGKDKYSVPKGESSTSEYNNHEAHVEVTIPRNFKEASLSPDKDKWKYKFPISTLPLAKGIMLTKIDCPNSETEITEMERLPYRNILGCLSYLAGRTRPDISYTISETNEKKGEKIGEDASDTSWMYEDEERSEETGNATYDSLSALKRTFDEIALILSGGKTTFSDLIRQAEDKMDERTRHDLGECSTHEQEKNGKSILRDDDAVKMSSTAEDFDTLKDNSKPMDNMDSEMSGVDEEKTGKEASDSLMSEANEEKGEKIGEEASDTSSVSGPVLAVLPPRTKMKNAAPLHNV
ncbi:hypothetical protein TNCV_3648721 [Trichonephila clavipes]|nr:hypothetical protein TNCV_3648721 [Trichonephila clavipes]